MTKRRASSSDCAKIASGQGEDMAEEALPTAVARKRTVGDTAIDDQQRRSGSFRFAIQIGPDLGFENHNHGRTEPAQHPADDGPVIDRREEDALRHFSQASLGDSASGQGAWWKEHGRKRPLGAQAADNLNCGKHFPYRDGVKPNRPGTAVVWRVGGRRSPDAPASRRSTCGPGFPGKVDTGPPPD